MWLIDNDTVDPRLSDPLCVLKSVQLSEFVQISELGDKTLA